MSALPWLILAVALAAYWAAAAALWRRRRRWRLWRAGAFTAGLALVGAGIAPPLMELAHQDFRAHMAQHLLLGMVAPLGLVFAAPVTLALNALAPPAVRRLTRVLQSAPVRFSSHPVTALALNVGGMYVLYLTSLYARSLTDPVLHVLVHWHFVAAGCLYVWAIAGPDPAPRRLGFGLRLSVLFAGIAAHAILAKLMYADVWPRGTHHGAQEIRAGAELMYYGGDLAELVLVIALFSGWYRACGRGHAPGRSTITESPPSVSLRAKRSVPS